MRLSLAKAHDGSHGIYPSPCPVSFIQQRAKACVTQVTLPQTLKEEPGPVDVGLP